MKMLKTLAGNAASKYARTLIPAVVLSTAIVSAPAFAETTITVGADRAKIISIAGAPASIIVGNPTFADASVRSGKLIVHGRHYGTTNLLILDDKGDEIANFVLNVTQRQTAAVVIYKAGIRHSYSCAPHCEATLSVGDGFVYFEEQVKKQISLKMETAKTSATLSE